MKNKILILLMLSLLIFTGVSCSQGEKITIDTSAIKPITRKTNDFGFKLFLL